MLNEAFKDDNQRHQQYVNSVLERNQDYETLLFFLYSVLVILVSQALILVQELLPS